LVLCIAEYCGQVKPKLSSAQITPLLQIQYKATTQWVHAPWMINDSTNARQCAAGILGHPWGVIRLRFDPPPAPTVARLFRVTASTPQQVHPLRADHPAAAAAPAGCFVAKGYWP